LYVFTSKSYFLEDQVVLGGEQGVLVVDSFLVDVLLHKVVEVFEVDADRELEAVENAFLLRGGIEVDDQLENEFYDLVPEGLHGGVALQVQEVEAALDTVDVAFLIQSLVFVLELAQLPFHPAVAALDVLS